MNEQEIEKNANARGWIYRSYINQPCTACHKHTKAGYLLMPGMNYPVCIECAEKEFA